MGLKEKLIDARVKQNLKRLLFSYNSIVILLVLFFFATFFVNRFTRNYETVIFEVSLYGFLAIGLGLVMITGNIDLSVGFQAASSAVIVVLVINATGSVPVGLLAGVATGAATGAINGAIVAGIGISPLIATISMNFVYKGFVYYFTREGSIYPEGPLRDELRSALAGMRFFDMRALSLTVVILFAALLIFAFVLKKTNLGNNFYVCGDNPEAAKLAGINVRKTTFISYLLCGICCGLAGACLVSNQAAAAYMVGEGREIFAISACVIGGIRMAGGKGTMLNVIIGCIIMRIISTSMNLMLVPAAWTDFVSGALLVAVLVIDKVTTVKKV